MVGCPFDRLSCGADLRCAPRRCGPVSSRRRTYRWSERWERAGAAGELRVFENPRGHAIGAPRLTIAPRVEPQEITWQLIEASIAVSIGSACSVRTSVRHGPLSLPNHMGQPIFAAARDARAHGSGSQHAGRHAPSVRPLTILNARRPRLDRRRGIRREIGFSLRVMNQRPAAPSAPF